MKKSLLSLALWIATYGWVSAVSPYANVVYDYRPAPGQFINIMPAYEPGDTEATMLSKVKTALVGKGSQASLISLGSWGGYVTVGFDHNIANVPDAYDFIVYGNATLNGAEPGVIEVMPDDNGNGLPDDTWYEIAGSQFSNTLRNYQITYSADTTGISSSKEQYIPWSDNQGGSGYLPKNASHKQSYFPAWITNEQGQITTYSLSGSKLPSNGVNTGTLPAEYWQLPAYEYGYADNQPNTSAAAKINIDWAVDQDGNAVSLDAIRFIRVHTGMNQVCGWLGESSTEVGGFEDLHPTITPSLKDESKFTVLDLTHPTTPDTLQWTTDMYWTETFNETDYPYWQAQVFQLSHLLGGAGSSWGGTFWDGFIPCQNTDTTDYRETFVSHPWGNMAQGGVGTVYARGQAQADANRPFVLAYYNDYLEDPSLQIKCSEGKNFQPQYLYVALSPWMYYANLHGVGGASAMSQNGQKISLIAHGTKAGQTEETTARFVLAEFKNGSLHQSRAWQLMDLTSLGTVNKIYFTIESWDMGQFGCNTPVYFCMDHLAVKDEGTSDLSPAEAQGQALRVGNTLYQLPEHAEVQVFGISGQCLYRGTTTGSTLTLPTRYTPGSIIRILSRQGVQTLR